MLNKKTTRIAIGLILLVFLLVSFVPSCYISNSSDGIINARTTTLKSPIEGVIHFAHPTKCGMFFKKDELIGQVTNARINRAHLQELITERKTLSGRIAALTKRLADFATLSKRLEGNIVQYQKYAANQLIQMIKQTEDKLRQEKAEFERSKKEFDANRHLISQQALKKREFETSEAAFLKSTSRIQELENHAAELKNTLAAVNSGVFLGDGHNDVPYSSQRKDQLVIETSLAETALNEARDRIGGIDLQIEEEQQRLGRMATHQIIAPFNALVWRMAATESSSVVIDSELLVLLNCTSIFLDFSVSESQFSDIKPGDEIQYRLIGESEYRQGKVFALRGSGTDLTDQNIAASLSKDPKREFHIWAGITLDGQFNPENFYQVGRRVEVKIPRKWHLIKEITRFFNVF